MKNTGLADGIKDVDQLGDLLSTPSQGVVDTLRRVDGDFMVLGAGGKMGPSVARMLRRAADAAGRGRRIIGVSRFSVDGLEKRLRHHGVETVRCDLLNAEQLARLPESRNVIFMAGMKFGSTGNESMTWAMNSFLPGLVACKYAESRIVAFSTGNVYGMAAVQAGGSAEGDPLKPDGEYAMSCLGRERILEHFGRSMATSMAIIRLNYAVEMRYGVLLDLARRVWAGEAIDLTMGAVNAIWQGDASAMAIQCFDHVSSPPLVVNVAGPEMLSVRRLAEQFGKLLEKDVQFTGKESENALLSNGQSGHRLFGYPQVPIQQVIRWIADWIKRGQPVYNKPTHFESRDGKF